MKTVFVALTLAALSAFTFGQDAAQPAQTADQAKVAKIIAEMHAGHGAVKNSPFSADEENESVQTLADGNRIVRKSTGKIYRNSDGRVRREIKGGQGGMLGTTFSVGGGTWIENPAMGHKYMIDDALKTAKVVSIEDGKVTVNGKPAAPGDLNIKVIEKISKVTSDGKNTTEAVVVENNNGVVTKRPMTNEEKAKIEEKMKAAKPGESLKEIIVDADAVVIGSESKGGVVAAHPGQNAGTVIARAVGGQNAGGFTFTTQSSKYESKTEDLGTRDFEGVQATGTRRTTTIPAGAIGNERPIEIVYERWFSKDLGMVVYSKNSDPRFGEQTYRLTNINRAEPDPSLFTVPQGYTITTKGGDVNASSPGIYRVTTKKPEAEKPAAKPDQQ